MGYRLNEIKTETEGRRVVNESYSFGDLGNREDRTFCIFHCGCYPEEGTCEGDRPCFEYS